MRKAPYMSLSVKILWISFVSMMSLIALLGYISQNFIMDTYKRQQTRYVSNLLDSTQLHLNLFMKTMQGNLLALSNDGRLRDSSDETIIPLLENYRKYWNQDLRNLYVIRPDLTVAGTNDYLWDIRGHRLAKTLYEGAAMSEYMYWSEPYMSDVSDYTVSVGVKITDSSGRLQGVLAADLDLDSIVTVYGSREYSLNEDLLILSADNRPITVSHPYVAYDAFADDYSLAGLPADRLDDPNAEEWYTSDSEGRGLYISRVRSNNWGWQIMAVLREEELYSSIRVLRTYMLWVGVLGALLSLVVSYYLSRYVSRPIRLLIKQMRRLSTGDFQTRITLPIGGEIGILVQSFNRMVQRIKKLMEELLASETEKKQYELKVLQAQIQPHFLYNTLNSISYLARRRQSDDVDRMITSLVELLHFHLDKVDEFVPVGQELEGVRHYAYLLSMRYPDRFALEAELDEGIAAYGIPKLTVQPLVENAIFHGILAKEEVGTIVLSGRVEDGDVLIEISDDGVGMTEEQLAALFAGSTKDRLPTYYHMGVKNIHDRLQLYYGPDYGLRVSSEAGVGTTVTVRLPASPARGGKLSDGRTTTGKAGRDSDEASGGGTTAGKADSEVALGSGTAAGKAGSEVASGGGTAAGKAGSEVASGGGITADKAVGDEVRGEAEPVDKKGE